MTLSEKNFTFVMHCGEMGSRWGFNRTIGQMCGLLIITKNPMTANEIADSLSISRGNVSMGIKELQSWQLIKVQHIPGDRKEYYAPAGDIWDMANRVFEERKNVKSIQRSAFCEITYSTKRITKKKCMPKSKWKKFTTYLKRSLNGRLSYSV